MTKNDIQEEWEVILEWKTGRCITKRFPDRHLAARYVVWIKNSEGARVGSIESVRLIGYRIEREVIYDMKTHDPKNAKEITRVPKE